MSDAQNEGLQTLARQDVYLARLNGLILSVLVEKEILTNTQVRALLEDVQAVMMDGVPLHQVLTALKEQFPE